VIDHGARVVDDRHWGQARLSKDIAYENLSRSCGPNFARRN
jgi:hypothetical protein